MYVNEVAVALFEYQELTMKSSVIFFTDINLFLCFTLDFRTGDVVFCKLQSTDGRMKMNGDKSPYIVVGRYVMNNNREKMSDVRKRVAFSDEFSRPIDVHRWSDYPEVDVMVNRVVGELEAVIPDQLKRNRNKYVNNVKVVLLDLYVAFLQGDDMWIGFPRKRANQQNLRFRKLHISGLMIMRVIDSLEELGYVRTVMGQKFYTHDRKSNKTGKQSRAQATTKLVSLMANYDINDRMISSSHDEIYLRKKVGAGRKQDVDIVDTMQTEKLRAEVRLVNECLAQADIRLNLSAGNLVRLQHRMGWRRKNFRLELHGTTYRRVYNQIGDDPEFRFGGRWYGHWCLSIPSEYRTFITINGEQTVELDYSGMHIRMLYDLESKSQPAGDMYSYPGCNSGKKARVVRKIILQTIINADSKPKAYLGAEKAIRDATDLPAVNKWDVIDIANKLMCRHNAIKASFCSGAGLGLQHHDAEIVRDVMLDLVREGIPCLPVHDSVIVGASHEKRLRELMEQHYGCRMGAKPVIDRKG